MNTSSVDATQSCEALLQNLNEDYQIIPMLKTALQRGWSTPFMNSLNSYIDEKQHAVQDICNKNYMQFCDSMDKVITMRRDVKDLSEQVSEFHEEISYSGLKALKEAERYISLEKTKEQVDKAYEDIVVFDNLVTLVERVNDLVNEEKYYLALKTLDTLKANLKSVPACRLSRNLESFIKPQTEDILERCRQSFYKWCREIRSVCQMIGEACMIRAFNRKQQDSESKQKKEGVEDILEKVDLSIVYEYQHVFEHVGKLHEFKRLYIERREPQCDFEVMASRNLKSLTTEQFCSLLNGLLYSSIGYFYVEDSLQRGSLLYSDSTHMQSLFASQLEVLMEALKYHLRFINNVEDLLTIETSIWTYADVMSSQPLLFNVEGIYEMRTQLVEQSVAIIQSSVVISIGDAIENERFERYVIHSAEDYFGPIARYQLIDEAPTAFPYTCQFTAIVPTVLQGISSALTKLSRVCNSLGVTENYSYLHMLVSSILDNVKEALEDQESNLEGKDIHERCIICLNWGAFAKSIDALQRTLLANDEKQTGGSLSLDKKRSDFITAQSRLQDQIIESIQTHCDEFVEDLKDPEELSPSQQNQQPHPCVSNMITYLKVTFELIAFLPRSFYEVCQFTTCRHIGQYFQQLLTESDESINVIGIFNLNLDLLSLESFFEELDTPDLVQCLLDTRQLYTLLLSGRLSDILDDEIRNSLYPLVALPILKEALYRIKEVKKLALGSRKLMIPNLKKKDIDSVLRALEELYMFKAYSGVIIPQLFGFLSIVCLVIGLFFTGLNIITTAKKPSFLKELSTGLIASIFLGLGSFFLLQWCGIYV